MSQTAIVIVEDEAVVALDIQERLEDLGYEVAGVASSGEDALRMVERTRPDLVLMDIILKGELDGIETASQVSQQFRTPVIYVTAHADRATLERAMVTEPYGYVLKPLKELELRTAIELALHKYAKEKHAEGQRVESKAPVDRRPVAEADEADDTPLPGAGPTSESERQELTQMLRQVDVFSDVDENVIEVLVERGRLMEFSAGELIAFEGDNDVGGFLVLHGRIALVKTSLQGKELVVELLPPGDAFGLIASLDQKPYPVTVKAQVDTKVLWVRRSLVLDLLDRNPELNQRMMQEVFDRLRGAHDLSRLLAHEKVEVRVASVLLALVPKFAQMKSGKAIPRIHMTRQEIADLIGSTSETVIRVTKDMERDGILDLTQSAIIGIKDHESLEEIATG
ncbi:MAG: response regulator [Bdellovibrionales bacterium]|nr:response regulator [Bdellovibrionales bacterium]